MLEMRAFGSTVCARSSPFESSDFKRRENKWKFVENAYSLSERIAIFSTILADIVGRMEALQTGLTGGENRRVALLYLASYALSIFADS